MAISLVGWASPILRSEAHRTMLRLLISGTDQQTPPNAPFRRPSAGGVEGVERHGRRESRDGPGMALRGGPLERHRSEGTPAQPGPDAGASVFGKFFPGRVGALGKSDSPSKAKPMLQPTRGKGPLLTQSPKSFAAKAAPTKAQHAGKKAKTRPTNHSLIGSEDGAFSAFGSRKRHPFALTTSSGSA